MAPKKMTTRKSGKQPMKLTKTKATEVMRDLHAVLDNHGLGGKIHAMAFAGNAPCTCPDGKPGVLRVVNGQLMCVCSGGFS
jgi:hypothetical protein